MLKKLNLENFSLIIMACMFAFGVGFHYFFLEQMLVFSEYFLFFWNFVVIYFFYKNLPDQKNRISFLIWLVLCFAVTLFLEILGTNTGIVFGEYVYGNTFKLKLLDAPILIGLNWVIVILGFYYLAKEIINFLGLTPSKGSISEGNWGFSPKGVISSILGVLLTASFATFFDWILEPLAIRLDYWSWAIVDIPLQNYLAWFIIALVFSLFLELIKLKKSSNIVIYYVIIQALFFIGVRLVLGIV
jgi:putative membrane protein